MDWKIVEIDEVAVGASLTITGNCTFAIMFTLLLRATFDRRSKAAWEQSRINAWIDQQWTPGGMCGA
jgi:hypothetical protein